MTTAQVAAVLVAAFLGGLGLGAVLTLIVARKSKRAGVTAFLDLELGGNDDRTAKPRPPHDPGHD